ncbi:MAG: DUF429 domain-containing protein [Gaiella sp.]
MNTRFSALADGTRDSVCDSSECETFRIGFGPRKAGAAAGVPQGRRKHRVLNTNARTPGSPFGPGLGLSAQSHALGPRIIHFTGLTLSDERICEVHPEVSFRALNGGRPLGHRKKSAAGAVERLELLGRVGIDLRSIDSAATAPLEPARGCPGDLSSVRARPTSGPENKPEALRCRAE